MRISKEQVKNDFLRKLRTLYTKDLEDSTTFEKYYSLGSVLKEYVSENWIMTNKNYIEHDEKQVYYFSIEFLLGKLLSNNLMNLGIKGVCKEALLDLDIDIEDLIEVEKDPGLGNGGLGRLAACFLDSMAATLIPGHGCGIRYKKGLFEQKIVDGYQVEFPETWLQTENVWETKRPDKMVKVKFGGKIDYKEVDGRLQFEHKDYEVINAIPYDTPIIGYKNTTVNTLRLWSAEPCEGDFDFSSFSRGDYVKAFENKYLAESISQVLYPDDSIEEGRYLRLKQEYFLVSAGLQSIIRTYKKRGKNIDDLDEYIAIHINDTHPALAVPELMRILLDEEGLSWEEARRITTNVISYTNHTIMAEALEKWPIDMFRNLLPRIFMIIEEINLRFCDEIRLKYPRNEEMVRRMSIIEDGSVKMAHLAIAASHSVNGVAKIHTEILKKQELRDFYNLYPFKFNNKTNGITHRRWLLNANPKLANLISETIGMGWVRYPTNLENLLKHNNKSLRDEIYNIKQDNKILLANKIKDKYNINIDPNSIFDIQVKRLHEYKRQILNILHILHLYNELIENPNMDIVPRTFLFGAKAAPSYHIAKQTIKLINTVGEKINNDKRIKDRIKVVFLENYNVTLAEKIIPSANISEQISTATKEASGTGNMKFMMNGAITLGTLDGANIEINDKVKNDNIIIFGMNEKEVLEYYRNGSYHSREFYNNDPRIKRVLDQLINGFLGDTAEEFMSIYDSLLKYNDEYFVLKDFESYIEAHKKVDSMYRNLDSWNEKCLVNIAKSGVFSSDRTIYEYATGIWNVKSLTRQL